MKCAIDLIWFIPLSATQFMIRNKVSHALYSLQSDHPAREDATSFNHPSDGSEDQEEARDSADQSGEDLFLLLLLWSIIHLLVIGGKGVS